MCLALAKGGRPRHPAEAFDAPEEALMALGGEIEAASLDRADSSVGAITDLLIDVKEGPRVRRV